MILDSWGKVMNEEQEGRVIIYTQLEVGRTWPYVLKVLLDRARNIKEPCCRSGEHEHEDHGAEATGSSKPFLIMEGGLNNARRSRGLPTFAGSGEGHS